MGIATTLLENKIEKIVNTVVNGLYETKAKDKDKDEKRNKFERADTETTQNSTTQKTTRSKLKNSMIKHSQIAYKLYPKLDKDAARSLFSKKFRNAKNDGDNNYYFNKKELTKINSMLQGVD
ncbi:MAG: hypothetical protein M0R03_17630 [Novosphingobium sp.]|nr:hypothetical protein [Novosphingobium sp.]